MGKPKKKSLKRKKTVDDNEPDFVCTLEHGINPKDHPPIVSEQNMTTANKSPAEANFIEEQIPDHVTDLSHEEPYYPNEEEERVHNDPEEDNESDVAATDVEKEAVEPQRKRKRGPTKMKHIAKDPNIRERVDFTEMGEFCGPGSVKLSSYVGSLVREHVPVTIEDWRKVSQEIRTVLWKSVQVRYSLKYTSFVMPY